MQVVVGHANPDFDAYASTVAATKLFPGSHGVFLGTQNANVRAFHHLHEEFLDFEELRGLDLGAIDKLVMVDTRDPDRIGELREVHAFRTRSRSQNSTEVKTSLKSRLH